MMINIQQIKHYVQSEFPKFGVNKQQEISRLLFEIAKRDKVDFLSILRNIPVEKTQFIEIKQFLIEKRFPNLSKKDNQRHIFKDVTVDDQNRVKLDSNYRIFPERFIIERSVKDTILVQGLPGRFPDAQIEWIDSYKDYIGQKKFGIQDYNQRTKNYFIVRENYDFFKRCACSKKSVYCGYHVMNLGSGCAFECTYCYLQDYINSPGIIIPANIEDFFEAFKGYKQNIRFGSGEITDSLVFDDITRFSPRIVDFFRQYPGSSFEFKTKSDTIDHLLGTDASDNIVISWSVNPQWITEEIEHYTAPLDRRIAAAKRCAEHGYKVAFHFDPMIYYPNWEKDYQDLVTFVYDHIPQDRLAWHSIGTLRMTHRLKQIIENRFPDSKLLDEEFIQGYDGKLRYPFDVRTKMYSKLKEMIKARDSKTFFYLCMEEKDACGTCETAPLKKYVNA